jgi:hypothetical protein
MNTLKTLHDISKSLQNVAFLIEYPQYANPIALSNISTQIQAYAIELKKLDDDRIKDLLRNGPKVSGEMYNITITLARPDVSGVMKEKHIPFGEYEVSIAHRNKKHICEKLKIEGPPDADDIVHFIHARAVNDSQVSFGIWITKAEAEILTKGLKKIVQV